MRAAPPGRRRSPTAAFLDDLAGRGKEPLLKSASGTLRFDLRDGDRIEHWAVKIEKGDVNISRSRAHADAVVRLDRSTFDGMTSGTVNATAALLRGDLDVTGDLGLVMLFQRVFPGPPR